MHRLSSYFLAAVCLCVASLPGSSSALDAELVVQTARKLRSAEIDKELALKVDGKILERDALQIHFITGWLRPIRREDGRVIGGIFHGQGEIQARIPAGIETTSWQIATNYSPLEQNFGAAYLRFTDGTWDELLGEDELSARPDDGSVDFRLFEARSALMGSQLWTRSAPNLLTDQLTDLFGGGHVGGFLLADFRVVGDGTPNWLGYFHNPRGGLMLSETTSFFTLRAEGGAPPRLNVLSSFGEPLGERGQSWDLSSVDLDVTFPTGGKTNSNLVNAKIIAKLEVVSVGAEPLRSINFELESERRLCTAQPDSTRIRIRGAKVDGVDVAAIHDHARLFVPLPHALQRGEVAQVELRYEGPLTQGVPAKTPDTYFSTIGPWAWYPRNPRPDRYSSKVSVHLPRFLRAIAPGRLTESREEKDGWHYTFEERAGVRNITLVVGDYVMTKAEDRGDQPQIIAWHARPEQEYVKSTTRSTRQMLDYVQRLWGPYPFSTLHLVEDRAYPPINWSQAGTGSGKWSCVPPGETFPFQGFIEGPSGMLLSTLPTVAPSYDIEEARAYDRLYLNTAEASQLTRLVDLTRQWWGHLVPPQSYRDVWIGEALSMWTALIFVTNSKALGLGTGRERWSLSHDLMSEVAGAALPLGLGYRMGRFFPFQAWGRGPLIVNLLVEELQTRPFLNALNSLINRSAATGISTETFLKELGGFGGVDLQRRVTALVEGSDLPKVEYSVDIDKDSGEVSIVLLQYGDPQVVDIPIEIKLPKGKSVRRSVRLSEEWTELHFTPQGKPKKVLLDPNETAMVKSLKKVKQLIVAPPEQEGPKETTP